MVKTSQPISGSHATAVITGSFLSGAMMILSLIAVPVFLKTNTDPGQLLRQWAGLYHYGSLSAPPMAITTLAMYLYTAVTYRAAGRPWAVLALAGITTALIIPFTLAAMAKTNDALFLLEAESSAGAVVALEGVRALVTKWSRMHLVRSLFPLAGAVLGITAAS